MKDPRVLHSKRRDDHNILYYGNLVIKIKNTRPWSSDYK